MKKTLFHRFICLAAVMLMTVSLISTATAIEDGTDTYAEENYSHILNEGNMVQPRKPVFPFTCDECHSSSYYVVAGSAQIDYDYKNPVYCSHYAKEGGDWAATESILLRCSNCNRGEQRVIHKWGVYCITDNEIYWNREISY